MGHKFKFGVLGQLRKKVRKDDIAMTQKMSTNSLFRAEQCCDACLRRLSVTVFDSDPNKACNFGLQPKNTNEWPME